MQAAQFNCFPDTFPFLRVRVDNTPLFYLALSDHSQIMDEKVFVLFRYIRITMSHTKKKGILADFFSDSRQDFVHAHLYLPKDKYWTFTAIKTCHVYQ